MAKIHVLDQDTVNKIAAGEVVGRPVSVVKELVENSIDSGASRITIAIQLGGKALIRIEDNGCGMEEADASLAFTRHATSKISGIQDLFFLDSMGFRGEAVPSIAAVSKFLLQSKIAGVDAGTEIFVDGGERVYLKSIPMQQGTVIEVRDLFYNIPARLKYLKTDKTEYSHILKYVYAVSLINSSIAFSLFNEGKQVFSSVGNGSVEEVASEVFTYDIFKSMLPVAYESENIKLNGYISTPANSRVDREKQWFFVNNRVVQSAIIGKALSKAISYIFPSNRHPYCFLHIEVDPSEVDVNVHPAKSEVKFTSEKYVYSSLYSAIKHVFEQGNSLSVSETTSFENFDKKAVISPEKIVHKNLSFPSLNRTNLDNLYTVDSVKPEKVIHNETVPKTTFLDQDLTNVSIIKDLDKISINEQSNIKEILQMNNTFLIFIYRNELYVIDQHVAHERILYEKLKSYDQQKARQELLIPETLFLDKLEEVFFQDNIALFEEVGFSIEPYGNGSFIVRAVPLFLKGSGANLVKDVLLDTRKLAGSDLKQKILISMSCKAAVKAGDYLVNSERHRLVDDWLNTKNNLSCPHGRPIAKVFELGEISSWFFRKK